MQPGSSMLTYLRGAAHHGPCLAFGSNSVQHGTAVFEGIRCYDGPGGPAVFRLDDHLRRLLDSARLVGIDHPYDLVALRGEVLAAATAAGLADAYLRPVLFTPAPVLGGDLRALPFEPATEVWPAPGAEVRPAAAARLTISPWRRPSPSAFPVRAKATGTYVHSALARTQAGRAGFDDAIQLDPDSGRVAEATVANVFLVKDGQLRTPWLADSVLAGITRDTVLQLAADLGLAADEAPVTVSELLTADEVFLTGTASEIVPVQSVDGARYPARPVTEALIAAFRRAVAEDDTHDWRTPVPGHPPTTAAVS
ncbi:aminotransferase class IV [Streptomyces sp. HK10]|uniref:aminotransferase class IV n=1 Tax=Streptomyces sp. HK10 TaxID=3373255 RepID=UPI003748D6D8